MDEKEVKLYTEKIEELQKQLKEYESKMSEKDSEIKEYKDEVEKKLAEIEQEKAEMFSSNVEKYIDEKMSEGKITPVQKSVLMALCSVNDDVKVYSFEEGNEKKSIEGNSFELIKMFIDEQEEVIPVGEKSKHIEIDKGDVPEDEKQYKAATEYAEKHNVDFTTALRVVNSGKEE